MPTTKFATTTKALQDIQSLKPEAAIKNIEGWEKFLKDHEVEGAKKLVTDLESLKKLLGAEKLDDAKIKTLMTKLAAGSVVGFCSKTLGFHCSNQEAFHSLLGSSHIRHFDRSNGSFGCGLKRPAVRCISRSEHKHRLSATAAKSRSLRSK